MTEWPKKKKASEIANITSGGTPSRAVSNYWGGDIPWVTPTDLSRLKGSKWITATYEKISNSGLENSGARIIPEGSLLLTSRASIGLRAINRLPIATNQGFKSFTFKEGFSVDFYYHYFALITRLLERRSSGTTFLEISSSEISNIQFKVDPIVQTNYD